MTISKEILDELLKGVVCRDDFFGDTGLIIELKIRLMERMSGAERSCRGDDSFCFGCRVTVAQAVGVIALVSQKPGGCGAFVQERRGL